MDRIKYLERVKECLRKLFAELSADDSIRLQPVADEIIESVKKILTEFE